MILHKNHSQARDLLQEKSQKIIMSYAAAYSSVKKETLKLKKFDSTIYRFFTQSYNHQILYYETINFYINSFRMQSQSGREAGRVPYCQMRQKDVLLKMDCSEKTKTKIIKDALLFGYLKKCYHHKNKKEVYLYPSMRTLMTFFQETYNHHAYACFFEIGSLAEQLKEKMLKDDNAVPFGVQLLKKMPGQNSKIWNNMRDYFGDLIEEKWKRYKGNIVPFKIKEKAK